MVKKAKAISVPDVPVRSYPRYPYFHTLPGAVVVDLVLARVFYGTRRRGAKKALVEEWYYRVFVLFCGTSSVTNEGVLRYYKETQSQVLTIPSRGSTPPVTYLSRAPSRVELQMPRRFGGGGGEMPEWAMKMQQVRVLCA